MPINLEKLKAIIALIPTQFTNRIEDDDNTPMFGNSAIILSTECKDRRGLRINNSYRIVIKLKEYSNLHILFSDIQTNRNYNRELVNYADTFNYIHIRTRTFVSENEEPFECHYSYNADKKNICSLFPELEDYIYTNFKTDDYSFLIAGK